MHPTDPRDAILQRQCPTMMVPKFGAFQPLKENGHRFLAAADGLWLEVRRPWLYALRQVGDTEAVTLPYGTLRPKLQTTFSDAEAGATLDQFYRRALSALPNEHAAWGVWNEQTRRLEYRQCEILQATPGSVIYERPRCEPHEHACLDMHSHGKLPAFFSATDDEDDRGEVKLAAVLGDLDNTLISKSLRVCLLGLYDDAGLS